MNVQRRKMVEQARDLIENAMNEEQESHDNLPDGLQDSEKGEAMQENADNLQEALDALDYVLER